MKDGNVNEFIDKLYYEDHYVLYNGSKYFFNGCRLKFDSNGKVVRVIPEIYDISNDKTLFSVQEAFAAECIEAFENSPIWDGKTFWAIEDQMQWVDE